MRASQNGFVLLEAVAALMIVSAAGIAVLSLIGAQLQTRARADELVVTDALARDRMLRLETLSREQLNVLPDSLKEGVFAPPFHAYRWIAASEELSAEPGLFAVTVVLNGPKTRQTLSTRFFRPVRSGRP